MPRQEPNVDLAFCETHDLLRIEPINGELDDKGNIIPLTFGTAELFYNGELYEGGIMTTSEVKSSLTSAADRVNIGVQNVDKQLGLTINSLAQSLIGSKARFMKAFRVESTLEHAIETYNATNNPVTGATSRVDGDNIWDAGGYGTKPIRNSGYVEIKLTNDVSGASWVGMIADFDRDSTTFGPGDPEYDWVFYASPQSNSRWLYIIRNGVYTNLGIVWNPGDVLRIQYFEDNTIIFYRNGVERYRDHWTPQNLIYPVVGIYNTAGNIQLLSYAHDNNYDAKILLTGEVSDIRIDENLADLTVQSDVATGQAFVANYTLSEFCPFVFKSTECGYVGPETFCSKRYTTSDGCAGRNMQHRFGGVVDKGELENIEITGNSGFPDVIDPRLVRHYIGVSGYDTYVLPQTQIYY